MDTENTEKPQDITREPSGTIFTQVSVDIPPEEKSKSLRASFWDAGFYASMIGFGETYFIPLLLAIGATSFQIGLFVAIPQFCIAFTQFIAIFIIEKTMQRKKVILPAAFLQIIVLGLFLYNLYIHNFNPVFFIILAAAYYVANGISIPAWNSLIGDVTHDEPRGNYFGRRNGLAQLVLFLTLFVAGLILQHYDSIDRRLVGFMMIIALALLSRIGSVTALFNHYDVPYKKVEGTYFSFWDFIKRSPKSNFALFVYYYGAMNLAVQVAAPFFAIYMLRDLGFSYIAYTLQLGVFVASQFLAMRSWGPFADRFGNRVVMRLTGALMPLVPILWFFSKDYSYLLLVQVIAGLAWGGWVLSAGNFIFDAVSPPKRARCSAYLYFFNSIGIFLGALLGAYLVKFAPSVIDTGAMRVEFISSIQFVFLISAALRFLVIIIFMPVIHEVRKVEAEPPFREKIMLLTGLRPFSGIRHEMLNVRFRKKKKPDDPQSPAISK